MVQLLQINQNLDSRFDICIQTHERDLCGKKLSCRYASPKHGWRGGFNTLQKKLFRYEHF